MQKKIPINIMNEIYLPVRKAYEKIVGKETNLYHEHIRLHRLSLYGEPCDLCNKLLRGVPPDKRCRCVTYMNKGN